ncbi:P-loop NTPase fold protein [Kitasatospora sp. NPDC052896]|uniref:P-loop NTPase fold protein n=1 Tax=Kitasatospora sp. NPDC052896 TaxID=3364061 RepID=UPI0037C6EBBC
MIIDALRDEAQKTESWLIAEVNPWLYADLDSLTTGLFAEIRAAPPKHKRWSTTRERIGNFVQNIAPLGSVGVLWGLNAGRP